MEFLRGSWGGYVTYVVFLDELPFPVWDEGLGEVLPGLKVFCWDCPVVLGCLIFYIGHFIRPLWESLNINPRYNVRLHAKN